ncbi:MAG: hypothetical protein ACYC8T_29945 [Myxococcaceae bacterium]
MPSFESPPASHRARAAPRWAALALAVPLLCAPAIAEATLRPDAPSGAGACLVCHRAPSFDGEAFKKSVHAELACADCHDGFDYQAHSVKTSELSEGDASQVKKLATRSAAPQAFLACATCHSEETEQVQSSAHGAWLKEERKSAGPLCSDCHGSPHSILKAASPKLTAARSAVCTRCHDNADFLKQSGLSGDPVPTYRDSVHGRLVVLGSERAPACQDCHGTHAIARMGDPASPLALPTRAGTCGKCHEGANEGFAATMTHTPLAQAHPGPHWTHIFFSYLTTLTLLGLSLHILLDLGAELRVRFRRKKGQHPALPASLPKSVQRLDIHQRIQHWMLISSVLLLVFTGWPLRAASVGPSRGLAGLLGGPHLSGILHRIAAVVMIAAGLYHLGYLAWLWRKKKLHLNMLPAPKDLVHLMHNLSYFLGLRREKPHFDRFSYVEKFDYWAVFWGVAIMAGTGFVYWFPTQFAGNMPYWVVNAAQLAHGEEATLCALALFVWHFYNVHLRPSIFPMNWAWLNGHISTEALKEEHPAEFDRMFGAPPPAPAPSPAPAPAVDPANKPEPGK